MNRFCKASCACAFLFTVHFLGCAAARAEEIKDEDCFSCHDQFTHEQFKSSVHGSNQCTSCHEDIKELPHPETLKPIDCGSCHREEAQIYLGSDHGIALKEGTPAASCKTCHGEHHNIVDIHDPSSPVYRLNVPKTCATCHENEKKMLQYDLLEKAPLKTYTESIHGKAFFEKHMLSAAICTDCHGSHDLHSPANPASKIYRRNVPKTCGKCHENVLKTYERSVHGKAALAGKVESPVCTDCHGEHLIRSRHDPEALVFPSSVSIKVCARCHAAEKIISKYRLPSDRLETYQESFHGLASRQGVALVANCASCHGFHDTLPSSDPLSSVNKNNLVKTCGKCHPNVSEQLAKGTIHLSPSFDKDKIVYLVTLFYIFLIVVVIGGMFLHNFLDFQKKFKEHYARRKKESRDIRFTPNERLQHLVLTVSFVLLAYTGFALKFPEAWWAIPFTAWDPSHNWRGWIHRAMAAIFSFLCVYHAFYLALTRRGREQLKALAPAVRDLKDLYLMIRHNLGMDPKKPELARYSYVEKAEYWALVWGSFIMIATGTMLVFENISLQYLPKWTLDVATAIHYYEAILATLAILVWHFYFVIFDPEHYPMNWSMWTGKFDEKGDGDIHG